MRSRIQAPEFVDLYHYVSDTIQSLYKSVLLFDAQNVQITLLTHLIAQLENPSGKTASFGFSQSLRVVTQVRPEIIRYMELHGFPSNSVFDTQKLFDILIPASALSGDDLSDLDSALLPLSLSSPLLSSLS